MILTHALNYTVCKWMFRGQYLETILIATRKDASQLLVNSPHCCRLRHFIFIYVFFNSTNDYQHVTCFYPTANGLPGKPVPAKSVQQVHCEKTRKKKKKKKIGSIPITNLKSVMTYECKWARYYLTGSEYNQTRPLFGLCGFWMLKCCSTKSDGLNNDIRYHSAKTTSICQSKPIVL